MKTLWTIPAAAFLLAVASLVPAASARSAPESTTWAGDTVHSFVLFKVKHMGTSWSHGRFNDFTISAQTADGGTNITAAEFTLKTESVDTGNEKRDQHLRNPDFLNAKQFPEASFKSTAAKAVDADTTELTGDLTFHGVTKPLTMRIVRVGSGDMRGTPIVGYETTFTLKRSDYGMTNMIGPVGDDITVTIAFEGAKT